MSESSDIDSTNYRGIPTGRLLIPEKGKISEEGYVLEALGLTQEDLEGKVLDVGIGQGNSLLQAKELGVDYYGVDLLPAIDTNDLEPKEADEVKTSMRILKENVEKSPDRLIAADATVSLPFADQSFDLVMSCYGLPNCARNPQELASSVLEMVRVAKDKVAFSFDYDFDRESNPEGVSEFGLRDEEYSFALLRFLDDLKEEGLLEYEVVEGYGKSGEDFWNIHLDVSNADREKLAKQRGDILAKAGSYQR